MRRSPRCMGALQSSKESIFIRLQKYFGGGGGGGGGGGRLFNGPRLKMTKLHLQASPRRRSGFSINSTSTVLGILMVGSDR